MAFLPTQRSVVARWQHAAHLFSVFTQAVDKISSEWHGVAADERGAVAGKCRDTLTQVEIRFDKLNDWADSML